MTLLKHQQPNAKERPTSVIIFGILNIVFAAFGVIGIFMLLFLLTPKSGDKKSSWPTSNIADFFSRPAPRP